LISIHDPQDATMFKGVLTEASSVRVMFKADHSNNGSTGFFFRYVPKEGREEETASFTPVAPGGSDTVESTVPAASAVWSLKIRVESPRRRLLVVPFSLP
jgi:hypothetical protein